MNKEIKELLETEIKGQIENLSDIQQGSEEFKTSVDSLVKLLNVSIEAEQKESQMKLEERKRENDFTIKNNDLALRRTIADNEKKLKESQLGLEQLKLDNDYLIRNDDLTLRGNIADNEKKHQIIKTCVEVGGIIAPLAVTIWGSLKAFEFEETGTVTTMIGKGFINKLLPRK